MGADGNEYFLELSRLSHALSEVDDRLAAMEREQPESGCCSVHTWGTEDNVESCNPASLSVNPSEGDLIRTSMNTFRDSLVSNFRDIYFKYANSELERLCEIHEDSPLGGLADQCAFAVTSLLDSIARQYEAQVEIKNSTVQRLLEFSDDLNFPVQAKGGLQPQSGIGAVLLSEGPDKPNNGIRVGDREIKAADEKVVNTEFITRIAKESKKLVEEISLSQSARAMEREIFSIDEHQEYLYQESIRPYIVNPDDNPDGDKTNDCTPDS
ncbi:hypothetical protein [Brevibacterium sp. W7.2]|uniref:hypothetical protein n=1 Tax=Brevibacterium sp. W7.2 TaxID=2823518 RepID=UPI001BA8B127|nr:hypothetical protein [Brevibacterium sp. W7.2]